MDAPRKTLKELVSTCAKEAEWREWIKTSSKDELADVLNEIPHSGPLRQLAEKTFEIRNAEPNKKFDWPMAIGILIGVAGIIIALAAWLRPRAPIEAPAATAQHVPSNGISAAKSPASIQAMQPSNTTAPSSKP